MAKRRKTTCANAECRRPCVPLARGLCDPCLKAYRVKHDRDRIGTRERGHYDAQWQRRSKLEIRQHIARYGYACPTCDTADAETNPLTCDHIKPRSYDDGLRVMCRRCNSRKGAKQGEPNE